MFFQNVLRRHWKKKKDQSCWQTSCPLFFWSFLGSCCFWWLWCSQGQGGRRDLAVVVFSLSLQTDLKLWSDPGGYDVRVVLDCVAAISQASFVDSRSTEDCLELHWISSCVQSTWPDFFCSLQFTSFHSSEPLSILLHITEVLQRLEETEGSLLYNVALDLIILCCWGSCFAVSHGVDLCFSARNSIFVRCCVILRRCCNKKGSRRFFSFLLFCMPRELQIKQALNAAICGDVVVDLWTVNMFKKHPVVFSCFYLFFWCGLLNLK